MAKCIIISWFVNHDQKYVVLTMQVEKKVVNLLAAAYEEGRIVRGSEVELIVVTQGEERSPSITIRVAGEDVNAAVSLSNVSAVPFYM